MKWKHDHSQCARIDPIIFYLQVTWSGEGTVRRRGGGRHGEGWGPMIPDTCLTEILIIYCVPESLNTLSYWEDCFEITVAVQTLKGENLFLTYGSNYLE